MADFVSDSALQSPDGFDDRVVLRAMLEQSASDLHLKVGCAPTLRVNGELRAMPLPPMRTEEMKALAHQQSEVRCFLASSLEAVISLRLVPRTDKPGRVPAAEVLINTAAVRDNIRDVSKSLNIPELIAEGTTQYGMQSFDQSLMNWYKKGVISYENALYFATNPSEFALRIQGVAGSSDTMRDSVSLNATV